MWDIEVHREVQGLPGGTSGKEPTWWCRRHKGGGFSPWVGKIPLEEGMAIQSSVLAWRIPWTEEPGRLQSMGSQRVRHNWSDLARMYWEKPPKSCRLLFLTLRDCSNVRGEILLLLYYLIHTKMKESKWFVPNKSALEFSDSVTIMGLFLISTHVFLNNVTVIMLHYS